MFLELNKLEICFFESSNKTTKCFELIHVDVCGPYRVPSSSGAVYLLTIVDDYSRAVWTYLLVAKSEVRKVVERFCKYTEKQFDKSVQMVRSDNGLEFMSLSIFFADNGIIHKTTCVYTPHEAPTYIECGEGNVVSISANCQVLGRSNIISKSCPYDFFKDSSRKVTV